MARTSRSLVVIAILIAILGCSPTTPGDVRGDMRDAYSAARSLFYYVWAAPDGFSRENHHQEIVQLLQRLSTDFHRVEQSAGALSNDPGFRIALLTNQRLLADARVRFEENKKDYSLWRLRNLTNNCIACHSRYAVPVDFVGTEPPVSGESFDSKFARAQFLLATRQFERSATEFFSLALNSSTTPADAFRALQLWLVAEVRVKNGGAEAARQLEDAIGKREWDAQHRVAIKQWAKDLRLAPPQKLSDVRRLLRDGTTEELSVSELNNRLVPILRASSFLHQLLVGTPTADERRQATFLLALAYSQMPIGSFEVFRELYLEQCIREFPNTKEAQQAFMVLDSLVQQENTGSGGLNIDEQQRAQLEELRSLAFGAAAQPNSSNGSVTPEKVAS